MFSSPEPSGSQGELIVYPWSGVRRPASVVRRPSSSVLIFKLLLLWNRLTNQSQISRGASLGRGNESLNKWSRSHDQDGGHAQKCSKPLKVFFSGTGGPISTKLGIWHRGLQPIIVYTKWWSWVDLYILTKFGYIDISIGKKVKPVDFSKSIVACDLKTGTCRQLIELMKVSEYWRSRSFLDLGQRSFTSEN